ncbi:MAG: 5-formyltetrahydrofolate cyclo-ligase [Steroidobacteraceae bacterium]
MNTKDEARESGSSGSYAAQFHAGPTTWGEVKAWRAGKRSALTARRMARTPLDRELLVAPIMEYLRATITVARYPVLGVYWPIRGEIDLREFARLHVEAGGTVGLPVVIADAAPLEFWRWQPGMALKLGNWNIQVPPKRDLVRPDVLVVPLVGFDSARYRLGYGGGFYDRTLGAAAPRPHTVGIAFSDAELPTIYPQPHDVPMDVIVTEKFTWQGFWALDPMQHVEGNGPR